MIISQNSNDVYYAYTRGRFWRWDGSARVWKESHLLAQKFDKAKAAEKHLTPEAFLTGDEFIPMDDYELPQSMLTALRDAKPCKNAPIDPVEEDSSSGVPAPCICSTCTCGGCKVINYRGKVNRTFAVPASAVLDFLRTQTRKSIPWQWAALHGIEVEQHQLRVHWRYDVDGLLKKLEEMEDNA